MAKQTIIMLHGFRGTRHGLHLIAKPLKDFNVVIPDMPGFAEGDHLDSYDLDSYVEWVRELVAAQKLKTPPVLLGHSFGSIVAAAYVAKYPKTISQLILVNPIGSPALEGSKAIMSKLAVFYYWLGSKLPNRLAHPWLASSAIVMVMSRTMTKTKDKKLRAFIHDQHRRYFSRFHSAQSVAEGFSTSIEHNVRESAPDINIPTLLIAGAQDEITPLAKQYELQKLFPHAKLEVIEHVGHLTHYETPDQVAAFIQSFVTSA